MPKVTDHYLTNKRNFILECTNDILKEKPLYQITMRDIIKKTGFSQGAIYRYYSNIDEIYIDLINKNTPCDSLEQKIDSLLNSEQTEKEVLFDCIIALGMYIEDLLKSTGGKTCFELTVLYAYDAEKRATLFPKLRFKRSLEYAQSKFVEYTLHNIEKGIFRPQVPIDSIIRFADSFVDGIAQNAATCAVDGSDDISEMFQIKLDRTSEFLMKMARYLLPRCMPMKLILLQKPLQLRCYPDIYLKKMSLHDSINTYIKELEPDCYYPSLLRLATHTSGYSGMWPLSVPKYLKYMNDLIFGGEMRRNNPFFMDFNIMKTFIHKSKLKDMEYSWKYSNFGMALVGYAISTVSGKPYWETMNDFLSNELELQNTRLGTFQNIVHGYDGKNNDCGNWHWEENNLIAPSSALTSTAEDLLQYAKLYINNERPYLSLCRQEHGEGRSKHDMGLAWWLLKRDNNIIWHCGGTGCFSSFMGIDMNKKIAAVVLSNYQFGIYPDDKIGFSILDSCH